MITPADLQFHTPADVDHIWAETYWFGLYVPEDDLYGWVYMVFRAGTGAVMCDVEFVDSKSQFMYDARYIDIQNHIPIPERLDSFTLPNGLTFEARSPSEYRIDYVGADETEMHLDCVGIHIPYDIHDPAIDPMARDTEETRIEHSGFGTAYSSHFDLTTRVTGTVKVRGKSYDVNCLATQDHSWGPRPERGMNPMTYMNAHFPDDFVVQTIFAFDPTQPDGAQHEFKHGYTVRDGVLTGLVGGTLKVDHRGIYPELITLSVRDVNGRTDEMTATARTFNNWLPYGVCLTGHSMLDWTTSDAITGIGTLMEAYPLDHATGGRLTTDITTSGSSAF
ncbi:hypothetical protein GIS00_01040 [Nakamurella sp. YIM 132087]|uniref:DUF7065 domain-containing protein n=1 Tax=Nakamurella alba TaxID=2665158 RepID=A0A7K1FGB6_9ACTN|nr:hypothetical protein [Nakamurella alba]MTD12529.1 hypothetical protein [Nakamurella alba]